MTKYGNSVRRSYEEDGAPAVRETPLPNLPFAQSLIAVPAMAMGQLVGVLVVETREPVAYDETDVQLLGVVATLVANAIEIDTVREQAIESAAATPTPPTAPPPGEPCRVRFFDQDGSVFLDGDYLIKGVAGRILWALVQAHVTEHRTEFTNRELRLDPALQLPEYRANLESRLILLKRRLDEREAPVRIEKTGRGRFRLDADVPLALES
jgi:hypothetical protein